METPHSETESIRIALTPDGEGKLVRDRILPSMIEAGEEPDFEYLKVPKQIAEGLRRKLNEELDELTSAGSMEAMIDEAADFLTVATAFHSHVDARLEDSFVFGKFQDVVNEWSLSMNEIEIKRRQRDNELGTFTLNALVKSVLIGPDNPRRQYYLDNPNRFPRLS